MPPKNQPKKKKRVGAISASQASMDSGSETSMSQPSEQLKRKAPDDSIEPAKRTKEDAESDKTSTLDDDDDDETSTLDDDDDNMMNGDDTHEVIGQTPPAQPNANNNEPADIDQVAVKTVQEANAITVESTEKSAANSDKRDADPEPPKDDRTANFVTPPVSSQTSTTSSQKIADEKMMVILHTVMKIRDVVEAENLVMCGVRPIDEEKVNVICKKHLNNTDLVTPLTIWTESSLAILMTRKEAFKYFDRSTEVSTLKTSFADATGLLLEGNHRVRAARKARDVVPTTKKGLHPLLFDKDITVKIYTCLPKEDAEFLETLKATEIDGKCPGSSASLRIAAFLEKIHEEKTKHEKVCFFDKVVIARSIKSQIDPDGEMKRDDSLAKAFEMGYITSTAQLWPEAIRTAYLPEECYKKVVLPLRACKTTKSISLYLDTIGMFERLHEQGKDKLIDDFIKKVTDVVQYDKMTGKLMRDIAKDDLQEAAKPPLAKTPEALRVREYRSGEKKKKVEVSERDHFIGDVAITEFIADEYRYNDEKSADEDDDDEEEETPKKIKKLTSLQKLLIKNFPDEAGAIKKSAVFILMFNNMASLRSSRHIEDLCKDFSDNGGIVLVADGATFDTEDFDHLVPINVSSIAVAVAKSTKLVHLIIGKTAKRELIKNSTVPLKKKFSVHNIKTALASVGISYHTKEVLIFHST